jgi:hypothetical protein
MNGQTISYTQNVASIMSFDTESFDTNAFHDLVTNKSRLTIPSGYGGKYLFTLTGITMGTVPGYVFLRIRKNGTVLSDAIGNIVGIVTGNNNGQANGGAITTATAGDYFEAEIQSDQTTGTKTIYGSFTCTFLGA